MHEIELMIQNKCELEESSENLKQKIEIIESERAGINIKINNFVKEMEIKRNTYNSTIDALNK